MRRFTTALLGAALLAAAGLGTQAQSAVAGDPVQGKSRASDDDKAKTGMPDGSSDAAPAVTAKAQPVPNTAKTDDQTDENPDTDGIAAMVNDESISDYEVEQRVALFIATTPGLKLTPENKKRIRGQILSGLEDEKVEMQEAVKKRVTVSPTEVDKRINALAQENNITVDQLRATLKNAGSNIETLREQLTAQIAWLKTVQSEYASDVNVSRADVDAELKRIQEGAKLPHYLVSEIFIPVDSADQEAKAKKAITDADAQLRDGASFQGLAQQLSQSPSAAAGGDMGWIRQNQLAPELGTELARMSPGSLSPPIRAPGGWYILALRSRQEPLGTDVTPVNPNPVYPEGSLPLARLLMPLGPSPSQELVDNAMKVAEQIRGHVVSCEGMDKLADQMKGSVYTNLGVTKLADLSKQIQDAMANSQPGDTAAPFIDEAGIEIIARCDKRSQVLTAYQIPSIDEIYDQLFNAQISALARRYKRDLKRDADVQVR